MIYKGLEYLRNKLNKHKIRVEMRYKQYDMTYQEQMIGLTIPPALRAQYKATIGWSSKAVDCL